MVIFTVRNAEEEQLNYRKFPEKELAVLLIKRGAHPYLGKWALPGGFVRSNETTEQAAHRELREETGVDHAYLEQLYTFSDPKRDPRTWVMSCAYMALVDSGSLQLAAGDDADQAAWFKLSYQLLKETKEYTPEGFVFTKQYQLVLKGVHEMLSAVIACRTVASDFASVTEYHIVNNDGLAFDHAKIIACAIERMRGKVIFRSMVSDILVQSNI